MTKAFPATTARLTPTMQSSMNSANAESMAGSGGNVSLPLVNVDQLAGNDDDDDDEPGSDADTADRPTKSSGDRRSAFRSELETEDEPEADAETPNSKAVALSSMDCELQFIKPLTTATLLPVRTSILSAAGSCVPDDNDDEAADGDAVARPFRYLLLAFTRDWCRPKSEANE